MLKWAPLGRILRQLHGGTTSSAFRSPSYTRPLPIIPSCAVAKPSLGPVRTASSGSTQVPLRFVEKLSADNSQLLQVILQKDEVIQQKDADFKQLRQQKDEVIQQKDDVIQRQVDRLLAEIAKKEAVTKLANEREQDQLSTNTRVLGLLGKRNLRGALEYVASRVLGGGKGGVQKGLDKLEDNDVFRAKVRYICKQHKLREEDVLKCLKTLYHTISKEMHGLEADSVCISFAHVTSTPERAALAAIFESQHIEYMCVDEEGNVLQPSPYRCAGCITGCD